MAVVVISTATLGANNIVTLTGTVDGVAVTAQIAQDLIVGVGDLPAQRAYVASRLAQQAAASQALAADVAALTGTVTV